MIIYIYTLIIIRLISICIGIDIESFYYLVISKGIRGLYLDSALLAFAQTCIAFLRSRTVLRLHMKSRRKWERKSGCIIPVMFSGQRGRVLKLLDIFNRLRSGFAKPSCRQLSWQKK